MSNDCPDCSSVDTLFVDYCQAPVELSIPSIASSSEWVTKVSSSALYDCNSCNLRFRSPQLNEEELGDFYRKLPSDHWSEENGVPLAWALAKDILLSEFSQTSQPSVLDVGAFYGGFLGTLPPNWKKSAIEPSRAAAEQLRESGVSVLADLLKDQKISVYAGQFDAVVMTDVLEHVDSPTEAIKILASLIKQDGLILLSTGTIDHWSWRLLKGNHWYLHTMLHLSFCSKKYFSQISRNQNLRIARIARHSHNSAPISDRLIQSVEVIFFWSRTRSQLIKKVVGLVTRIPVFRYLRHKKAPPFTPYLKDHVLVVLKHDV